MNKTNTKNEVANVASNHSPNAIVVRVVENTLAYAVFESDNHTVAITPDLIAGYNGEPFSDIGVAVGAPIHCAVDSDSESVTSVRPSAPMLQKQGLRNSPLYQSVPVRNDRESVQSELHPKAPAEGTISAPRALPPKTRRFGKLVDTSALRPGDLFLTREVKSTDTLSELIKEVQLKGGYHENDARWTHAAMYLGDNASLVEANVDSKLSGGNVRVTSLDDYCDGKSILRFRRPKLIQNEREGWKMCIRALSRLNKPYDMLQAVSLWFRTIIKGKGFFDNDSDQHVVSSAVICSTLYADSYNEVTRRSLGELNGTCVPAWLSVSDQFEELQVGWLCIR